jgi:hypothetical protein
VRRVTLPSADNVVRQGVTTIFEGPDGNSPVPLTPFLKKIEALRKTIKNVHRARIDSQRRYGPRQPPAYARTLVRRMRWPTERWGSRK